MFSVTIPNSVTEIGDMAFYDVRNIIYNGTATGRPWGARNVNAFADGDLIYSDDTKTEIVGCSPLATEITIPSSVRSISSYVFSGCSQLEAITVAQGNTVYDSRDNCNAIIKTETNTLIAGCKNTIIPNSVTSIENRAFSGCIGLTAITIPNSVTSIGVGAFSGCSGLATVTIPNSVTSIGVGAFSGCSGLTSVAIPNSVTSIGGSVFSDCSGLTFITIPNSVIEIDNSAFYHCSSLSSVTIPSSVTTIGEGAFYGCTSLTSVTIPNSVTEIGRYAFGQCTGLVSVTIGNSVTSIGEYAFSECSSLACDLVIPSSVTSIDERAFYKCSGLASVTIGNGVTSIGQYAFFECYGLTAIYYNGDVAGWCNFSFCGDYYSETNPLEYAHNLYINGELVTDLVIPETVTEIKSKAFSGATCLISVTISNSVTSIGKSAFSDCNGITDMTIGNSVDSIADGAFYNCSGLTSITIPNSVVSIGNSVFNRCSELSSITIGSSVASIGSRAFEYCGGLDSIYVDPANTVFDSRNNCNALIETATNKLIYGSSSTIIPNTVTSIGEGAFEDCSSLTSITIPNSVTSIGNDAFWGCSGLTSVIVGDGVTSIRYGAFGLCRNLTDVTIGRSVTSIYEGVFAYCSNLSNVFVKANEPPALDHLYSGEDYGVYGEEYEQYGIYGITKFYTVNLWVPCGTEGLYRADEQWGQFGSIQGSLNNYTLNLVSANPEMGTARMVQAPECATGTAIIEAVACEGYAFLSWNDGNNDNPRTVEINSDTTFMATFAEARTVTVEVSDSEMGYVIGGGEYAEGAVVQIEAVPYDNYRFDHWIDVENPTRDFNTDNPRTIVVSSDVSYIAVFEVVTGIDEFDTGIDIYPTTVTDILNITSSETISEIEIVNMMGQVVRRLEVNSDNAVCDVNELTSGVYVVRIRTAKSDTSTTLSVRRFVKE